MGPVFTKCVRTNRETDIRQVKKNNQTNKCIQIVVITKKENKKVLQERILKKGCPIF